MRCPRYYVTHCLGFDESFLSNFRNTILFAFACPLTPNKKDKKNKKKNQRGASNAFFALCKLEISYPSMLHLSLHQLCPGFQLSIVPVWCVYRYSAKYAFLLKHIVLIAHPSQFDFRSLSIILSPSASHKPQAILERYFVNKNCQTYVGQGTLEWVLWYLPTYLGAKQTDQHKSSCHFLTPTALV